MRTLLAIPALFALATAALPCSVEPLPRVILQGGEAAALPDTGVTLRLTDLTDQRCPPDVDCVWEGMVRAVITVTADEGGEWQVVLCNRCDDGSKEARVEEIGLVLQYLELAPSKDELASLGRAARLDDYRMTLAWMKLR